MRRRHPSGPDQIYADSEAARLIPELLDVGLRVCLITGHGWTQLTERLLTPLVEDTLKRYPTNSISMLSHLFVYANRGATRLSWRSGCYAVDHDYGLELSIDAHDRSVLLELLIGLRDRFMGEFTEQRVRYCETYPDFPFGELPPQVFEREAVVMGLRPLPSDAFCAKPQSASPRHRLALYGYEALEKAGLHAKYDLSECGRSTLEISKTSISKSVAFRDLMSRIAADLRCSVELVERAALYVGDEFAPGGNDSVIMTDFPGCQCFSVVPVSGHTLPDNLIQLSGYSNPARSAAQLSGYMVKVLVESDLSDNLAN
jgi:hypothetical protein